jgi:hypothetical protein
MQQNVFDDEAQERRVATLLERFSAGLSLTL